MENYNVEGGGGGEELVGQANIFHILYLFFIFFFKIVPHK